MEEAAVGKLTVITGPMWAGKTTLLIQEIKDALFKGQSVAAFRPSVDTRYSSTDIVSHDGENYPAITLNAAEPFFPKGLTAKLIVIEEAHFYPLRFAHRTRTQQERGSDVIVAGISRHWDGSESFPVMNQLMQWADNVVNLTAECAECGGAVSYTKRKKDAPEGAVGGAERYVNLCASCDV